MPRVFLWQWVASSFLLICFITSSSLGSLTPLLVSSQCLACFKSCRSSWHSSKIHWERRPRKMAYVGWDSVVQPTAMCRIKCQMLRDFTISDHWEKRSFVFTAPPPQQSQSTLGTLGVGTPASKYLYTRPAAIGCSLTPSLAVLTLVSICALSFATFVAQAAVAVL